MSTQYAVIDPASGATLSEYPSIGDAELVDAVQIADEDYTAANTQDAPDRVVPRPFEGAQVADGVLTAELAPASWTMFLVKVG